MFVSGRFGCEPAALCVSGSFVCERAALSVNGSFGCEGAAFGCERQLWVCASSDMMVLLGVNEQ